MIEQQIVIIGAGIGGLSAAIRLAASGERVQLFERQSQVGGKLNRLDLDGFHFDTGPSLITMPQVLHNLFRAAGKRLEDYLELRPLELTCRYFYRDGLLLNAWRDRTRLAEEFSHLYPRDGEALQRFIEYARTIYQAAADPFLYHSLGTPLEILDTFIRYILRGHDPDSSITENDADTFLSRCLAVGAALSPRTLDQQVSAFFQDPHLRQLFDRYATYNGSSPYQIGSVYSIIPYVELAGGGWYPCGGIYALAQALEKVALELGVTITTSSDVKRILVERGEARGIVLADGKVVRAKSVIANSDVVTTHRELLSPALRNPRQMRQMAALEPSCSGFVLMLGIKGRYPQLAHHNIFFSDDYKAEFVDLFEERIPLRNPTIYICASSRTDETQSPPDTENLFVLVNAPYLTAKSNWQQDAPAYREHILKLLSAYPQAGLGDLQERILCEAMLTPKDFQQLYGANAGSIYGLSSNARMAPFTRPGNRSQTIRNLYFVGGSTHPGGGVPLVMLSGKIVSELVLNDQYNHTNKLGPPYYKKSL